MRDQLNVKEDERQMETITQQWDNGHLALHAVLTVGADASLRYHRFIVDGERYRYDFELCRGCDGWKQYDTDQDAWYFGVWVHLGRKMVVTYAEGDEYVTSYPTAEALREELVRMAKFYGDPPPAFTVIDMDAKTITNVYDTRPEVL